MAHWFHRNPLKATAHVGFEMKGVLTSPQASKICSELRLRRDQLLEHLKDANNDTAIVEDDFHTYLALFYGFFTAIDEKGGDSKLKPLIRFKWTSSMLGGLATELSDSWFEVLNMSINMALWYTKHAARVAGRDEVSEAQAKEVHTSLRKAAGLFQFVKENASKVSETPAAGSDLDANVLSAYINQSTAEAQEVTVARAIELKHSPSLVSALAKETADLFTAADKTLQGLDQNIFMKWRRYCQLKAQFYMTYAYGFLGESLLAEDKCGEAVRACKEGESCMTYAEQFCKEYAKAQGPGLTAKPEQHLFFRRINPILKRHMDKAERENGFIYHQKVPQECPELQGKATHGLVKAEQFALPPPSSLWNPTVYQSFDINKTSMPDFSKSKKSTKDLPAVKEAPIYQTDKDPNNSSGCVVS
uniref:BRO1 domain-containing protein n=1 Tax=Plectus sambesii TaxID=2011161 RepID=A0A914WKG6_9BILA